MKVKIFTEGGKSLGLGHLSRCTSLYDEIYNRGINVDLFVHGDITGYEFLKDRSIIKEDWLSIEYLTKNIASEDYVIVDSYKADRKIYEIIAHNSKKVLYIDDTGRLNYPKGIILNPALDASHVDYSISSENILLTGSKYIILRESFIGLKREHLREDLNRVLVIMGGTDVRNITPLIINKLCKKYQNIFFDIILGQSHFEFKNTYKKLRNINFYESVSENEMRNLMLNSDLAITAAGQTIYELMASKTPFIAVQVVDNQRNNVLSISEHISSKIVLKCDDNCFIEKLQKVFEDLKDINIRKTIVEKMKNSIDGLGRKRIINALLDDSNRLAPVFLREVKEDDIKEIFNLSNKDYVRRYSINKNKIHWVDHVYWFNNILKDKNVVFYVVTDEEESFLGQVRYDISNQRATVSISLTKKLRGKGLSKTILHQSIDKFFKDNVHIEEIIAFVSENNIASKKIFEGLNFKKVSIEDSLIRFILKREDFYVNRSI